MALLTRGPEALPGNCCFKLNIFSTSLKSKCLQRPAPKACLTWARAHDGAPLLQRHAWSAEWRVSSAGARGWSQSRPASGPVERWPSREQTHRDPGLAGACWTAPRSPLAQPRGLSQGLYGRAPLEVGQVAKRTTRTSARAGNQP